MSTNISEQAKREGLATELADIAFRQRIICEIDDILLHELDEAELTDTLRDIGVQDHKHQKLIETCVLNFGLRAEPKPGTVRMVETAAEIVGGSEFSFVERLGQYALLKDAQAMCSSVLQKAALRAPEDVREALVPFAGVQSEIAKQLAQIDEVVSGLSVEIMMGEAPAKGLISRAREFAATAVGAVLGKAAKPADEMSVLDALKLDHRKVMALFKEIEATTDGEKRRALCEQLRVDLTSHSEAEEVVVYSYFDDVDALRATLEESWSEHEEMRSMLDQIEEESPTDAAHRSLIAELKVMVERHVAEEEGDIFDRMRADTDEVELVRLAGEFAAAKERIQEAIAGVSDTPRAF